MKVTTNSDIGNVSTASRKRIYCLEVTNANRYTIDAISPVIPISLHQKIIELIDLGHKNK